MMYMLINNKLCKNKIGFMKTVEVFMAIIILFTFLIFLVPRDSRSQDSQSLFRLQNLERDDVFRDCVISRNSTCINETLNAVFQGAYLYDYVLYEFAEPLVMMDHSNVNLYTWFFAGTRKEFRPIHFRLFYWDNDFEDVNMLDIVGSDGLQEVNPEFIFLNLTSEPNPGNTTQDVLFLITVENLGDSADAIVSFYLDGDFLGTSTYFVENNQTEIISFSHRINETGTYTLSSPSSEDDFELNIID